MKTAVPAAVATALLWTAACGMPGPEAPPVEAVQQFSLRAGQSASVAGDEALRVGFDGVTADSRCAKNERCVWAGDATVRVWLQRGAGARQVRELHVAPGPAQAARIAEHELRLLRLDPYPAAGRTIDPHDYLATLALVRGGSTDAER